MKGSCLCGEVVFKVTGTVGPFELCHCNRCRKASGSAYAAALVTESQGFEIVTGRNLIKRFDAPIISEPPAYTVYFCSICGSHLPDPEPKGLHVDIPAGLLDDELSIKPDKHIYTDCKANWDQLDSKLPEYTESEFKAYSQLQSENNSA